jgi:hypothetical protein
VEIYGNSKYFVDKLKLFHGSLGLVKHEDPYDQKKIDVEKDLKIILCGITKTLNEKGVGF